MASPDTLYSVHRDIITLVGPGCLSALFGMSAAVMGYEYRDINRVEAHSPTQIDSNIRRRHSWSLAVFVIGTFLYIAGLVLISTGIGLYRQEREEIADSISGIIRQTRRFEAQPETNEVAILTGVASALILMGAVQSAIHFYKTESFGALGASIFGAGWLLNAFSAACNDVTLSSLRTDRLIWSLCGAGAIVGGTFMLPFSIHHAYVGSPAWAIMALGYVSFAVSTSFIVSSPDS